MSEAPDPLEAELSAVRPQQVSPELRHRIAQRVNESPPPAVYPQMATGLERTPSPSSYSAWLWRTAVAGCLAAACLVAFLLWREGRPRGDGKDRVPGHTTNDLVKVIPQPSDDSASMAALLKARRDLDETEPPAFVWPLPETSPITATGIPPELLD
jgi:hypothetical protein